MPAAPLPAGVVVDCSVTLPWFLEDEKTAFTESLLELLPVAETWVPVLWRLEFANALLTAERRGRISGDWRKAVIEQAGSLPIGIDAHLVSLAHISALADQHGLTAYDAAYLEVALRRKLPLATLDGELVRAAREAGCALLTDTKRYPPPRTRKK